MLNRRQFVSRAMSITGVALVNPITIIGTTLSGKAVAADADIYEDSIQIGNESIRIELLPGVPLHKTRTKADELLGSTFSVLIDETELIEITLDSVEDLRSRFHTDNFAMIFHTYWDTPLSEKIYTIEHPAMGRFQLYLRPSTTKGSNGFYYEVVVSHLIS